MRTPCRFLWRKRGLPHGTNGREKALSERKSIMFLLQRLRDLREDMDLYQKDIADYLHCSQVTYSRYELGTREIPLESLNALADFYGVSIDYLMGRTDEKKPYPKGNR